MGPVREGISFSPRDIHDFWLRVLASPVIGALVANLSGLIDHRQHSAAGLAASYAWFAIAAFVIWEGNRRLYFRLPRREDWLLKPRRRLGLLLVVLCLYTIPVATGMLLLWRKATGDGGARPYALVMAVFAIVGLVIAIAHVYETVFLLRDWESDRLRSARLEHARLEAELESLGREVDAHFLFNNLNSLAHLVEQRSDRALGFIRALGATYRYVLDCRGRPLVPLADELEALERHHLLAQIRDVAGVSLSVEVTGAEAARWMLPPVSLGELFHNALKHNTVTAGRCLQIRVRLAGATLVFENDLAPARLAARSTGLGLVNLRDRFLIATGSPAEWVVAGHQFVVRLPLVERAGHGLAAGSAAQT
jgi:Histidine kinase